MVQHEIEVKSQPGFNILLRLGGFLLSASILYFIVHLTLELSKVKIVDLPVVTALEVDFKKKPTELPQEIIENGDLSINSLRGDNYSLNFNQGSSYNSLEETLTDSEKPVPLSMKQALENSITEALKRLAQNEIISQEEIYKVYFGSFDSYKAAEKKLKVVTKINELSAFSIVPRTLGEKSVFRLETKKAISYENAKLLCDQLVSDNLECKVIKDK